MFGVDVSNHQGRVDWDRAVNEGGVEFALVKATEGVDFDDAWFARNWAELGRLGLPRGAYHYALPSANSSEDEAAHFLAIVGDTLQPGDLVALDMEDPAFPVGRNVAGWTLAWLRQVEAALGFAPLLYTYPSYVTERQLTDPALPRYPLWWASYDTPPRAAPPPWAKAAIVQYTAFQTVPGLGREIDCNRFDGDAAALRALGKPGSAPVPGPARVTTPATDWEGEGEIVSYEQIIVVRNGGMVSQRRQIDSTMQPWQQLSKGA